MKKGICLVLIITLVLSNFLLARAGQEELRIAVAANFIRPMDEIAALFEGQSGIRVKCSYSSTGQLYAQIVNGAPFDLFLAADQKRPQILFNQGLAGEPFVYARGQVVLWTARGDLAAIDAWRTVVERDDVRKIAIPNPETAPYGEAAAAIVRATGLWPVLRKRFVYGQNVAQAFQYGQLGVVDAAFTSFSYGMSPDGAKGKCWPLAEAESVVQQGCLLNKAQNPAVARQFVDFLLSDQAKNISAAYGYR